MKECIYVVEDDENIRELVGYALRSQDFEVETFADSKEFWPALEKRTPALFLLDIMLPGESGNDILDKLRKTQQELMLSKRYVKLIKNYLF